MSLSKMRKKYETRKLCKIQLEECGGVYRGGERGRGGGCRLRLYNAKLGAQPATIHNTYYLYLYNIGLEGGTPVSMLST